MCSSDLRITDKNVNAAIGGVPDINVIRETLTNEDPRMYNAVMLTLGMDPEGNFLIGANGLPQVFSLKKAAETAGLGKQSSALSNVLNAMNLTPEVRRKYLASQTGTIVTGKNVSEAGTGADVETPQTALIENQKWYEPIKKKGLEGANHAEIVRAAMQANRFLENPANEPIHAQIMGEVQKRANRPEFRAEVNRAFGRQSEALEVAPEEEVPGQEVAIEEPTEGEETPEVGVRPTPGTSSAAITRAAEIGRAHV